MIKPIVLVVGIVLLVIGAVAAFSNILFLQSQTCVAATRCIIKGNETFCFYSTDAAEDVRILIAALNATENRTNSTALKYCFQNSQCVTKYFGNITNMTMNVTMNTTMNGTNGTNITQGLSNNGTLLIDDDDLIAEVFCFKSTNFIVNRTFHHT